MRRCGANYVRPQLPRPRLSRSLRLSACRAKAPIIAVGMTLAQNTSQHAPENAAKNAAKNAAVAALQLPCALSHSPYAA